jgi:hypothetical protein
LCDTSTMNRKKPKPSHIGRHFIKAPQTMAWSDSQHRGLVNSAGLGLQPQKGRASSAAPSSNHPRRPTLTKHVKDASRRQAGDGFEPSSLTRIFAAGRLPLSR